MALDPNIIMSGQSFDPTKGINAAQNIQHNRAANKLLGMKTQAAENEAKRNAVVDQLSAKAAGGDQNALQQLNALDPKRGQAINKLHLQHLHQQIHDEATAAYTVKNSANPQQTWHQVRSQLIQKYPHLADHIPDQYDPATVDFLVNNAEKAKTLVANQINQQQFKETEGDKAKSRQETARHHKAQEGIESNRVNKPSSTDAYELQLIHRGTPPALASDIAHGKVKVQQDQFGNTHYLDAATGKELNPSDYQGQQTSSQPTDQATQTSQPHATQPTAGTQPTDQPVQQQTHPLPEHSQPQVSQIPDNQSTDGQSSDNQQSNTKPTGVFAAIPGGSGPEAYGKTMYNNTIGAITGTNPFGDTSTKKETIGLFNQTVRHLLMPSGRPSNYTQKQINDLLPDPNGLMVNPGAETDRLKKLRSVIQDRIHANTEELSKGHITEKHRGELSDSNSKLHTILGLMGQPGGSSNSGDSSTPISQMSKSQLDALNPDNMTHEQLQEAAKRQDELDAQ